MVIKLFIIFKYKIMINYINLINETSSLPLNGWIHQCNLCNHICNNNIYYYQSTIYIENQIIYLLWLCNKCINKYNIKYNNNNFIYIRNLKIDKYIHYFYKRN